MDRVGVWRPLAYLRTINDLYIPVPEVYNVSGPPETPSSSNMSAVTEERSR